MCSIFNDLDNNINSEETFDASRKDVCKCGNREIVLTLTLYGSFCKECFLQRVAHKFRSEFGKSRLIRDNEDVAVAFSGGKKSMALVNLIKEGRSKRAQKKLRFKPTLIYILEPKQWESSLEFDHEVIQTIISLEIPFYIFSFNQAFDEELIPLLSDKDELESFNKEEFCNKIDLSKFYDFKKSLKQPTSGESMLYLLRKRLLMRICKNLNLSKVLVGDTASQLAVRLLSFVSQGRGGQLSYEMEFADDRNEDVTFVKPMRAFLDEEIETLLKLKELKFFKKTKKWEVQTIETLTEEFINKLQSENDKTLSIICRTGEKLTVAKGKSDIEEDACCLCKALIDRSSSAVTADSAVKVSSSIADKLKTDVNKRGDESVNADTIDGLVDNMSLNCCKESNSNVSKLNGKNDLCKEENCCNSAKNVPLLSKSDIMVFLCYGCQILVKDMSDVAKLPQNFHKEILMKIRRRNMKESIEDFILNEEEDSQT